MEDQRRRDGETIARSFQDEEGGRWNDEDKNNNDNTGVSVQDQGPVSLHRRKHPENGEYTP